MGNVNYVARVYRQHNSMVLTVPKGVCDALDVRHGDLVDFNVQISQGLAIFSVILRKDGSSGGDANNIDLSNYRGPALSTVPPGR